MKEVVVVLLVALMLNGCGSSTPTAQTASGGVWQSQMSGGAGESSGFSFVTQFTVGGNGALSISNFQFLTSGTCFPVNGGTESGTLDLDIQFGGCGVGNVFLHHNFGRQYADIGQHVGDGNATIPTRTSH